MEMRIQKLRGWWGRVQAPLLTVPLLLLQAEQAAAGALERAMAGKSQVVDLTQAQTESVLVGGVPEHARPERTGENERNGLGQRVPGVGELVTQLDLPSTVLKGKPTVAQIPASDLLAHAVVVDIAPRVAQAEDYRLTAEDLRAWERRNGRIPKGSMVLLHTGWARRWSGIDPARYLNLDTRGVPRVPGISPGAIALLINERDIRGVGLDTWVPERAPGLPGGEDGMRPLFYAGKWQLVNLTNLDRLPAKGAKLVIAPLRVDAGSAPARVIAILP
jgi:kynurenine formamidase